MTKHLQIRSLPEAMHRKLKIRASREGLSMSDYLKRLIGRDLDRPSWDDMVRRMNALEPITLPESTAEMIRRERDSR